MYLQGVFDPDGFQLQPICLLLLYVFYYKVITCNLKVGLDTPDLLRAQAAKPAAPVFL